jgi:hypothetical protein
MRPAPQVGSSRFGFGVGIRRLSRSILPDHHREIDQKPAGTKILSGRRKETRNRSGLARPPAMNVGSGYERMAIPDVTMFSNAATSSIER